MKAMILAAGKGTRLLPLTLKKPKALIEINGVSLLEICLRKLADEGFKEIVINVHHLGCQIIDFLKIKQNFGLDITISDESDELLDSGGGILKALPLLGNEPFLIYNVDVISNISINKFCKTYNESSTSAILAVRNRNSSRRLLADDELRLRGWRNEKTLEIKIQKGFEIIKLQPWAFSGIHIIDPSLFKKSNFKGRFSIIDLYLEAAAENRVILYPHDNDYWFDLGKIEDLEATEHQLNQLSK